ncbi:MAG TPA: hypothetical protein VK550_02225 [Polyangiaceae bacterium]|nr:hypothetical protein [Polyangiaceae bacterium]
MDRSTKYDVTRGVSDVYIEAVSELSKAFRRQTTIKILVVVDGSVSLTEDTEGFGVGRIVRLLRESTVGCTRFEVDTARRDGDAGAPTYRNFRFDLVESGGVFESQAINNTAINVPIINKYDEVWCFGFNPGNLAGPDEDITHPGAQPTGDNELKVLTQWMNDRRGGLLAMGDHDYLGASMCHRIPRIRSMRRWTAAQGVPPIGGASQFNTARRIDTNQPFTAGQMAGTDIIPFEVQEDSKPQRIDWVPWIAQQVNIFQIWQRPHPILCHPVYGPIDVMPDHPHEGWLFEDSEIDLAAPLEVPTLAGDEYPTVSGNQPRPTLIAYGTTTPNPPFRLAKGPSPKKRFGMISVYDGHAANVGRVATDSTWHHWFDQNIDEIEAKGGENWAKISRYFLNVATWLAPPMPVTFCLAQDVLVSHFTYVGFQEYTPKSSVFDLGRALYTELARHWGPCWVSNWVLEQVRAVDTDFWAWLKDRLFWKDGIPVPGGDPCLSCPPFELIELAVLGGMVRATFPTAADIKAEIAKKSDRAVKVSPESLVKIVEEGVAIGLKELRRTLARSIEEVRPLLRQG